MHEKSSWHAQPKLICCLTVYGKDGKIDRVVSDESFRSLAGSTVRACLYTGETVDGRIADVIAGWETPDYDDSGWNQAVLTEAPMGRLVPAEGPSIRVKAEYAPLSIQRVKEDTQLVTFPYNISGWCHIWAQGTPGQEIRINYGEEIHEDGSVRVINDFIEQPSQTDCYILGKDGFMDWEPKFSYKGFRYVEIIGAVNELKVEDIIAKQVASDVSPRSEFWCSEPLLNQIYDMVVRTMQNNLHSIPTDTPVYEKNGWIGDAGIMGEAFVTVFDIDSFYRKWLIDMEDSTRENGQLPLIVPSSEWGLSYSPEWCDCPFELVWQLYLRNGELSILQRFYPMLQKHAAFALTNINEKGIPNSVLWDWLPPGYPDGGGPEGPGVTSPCYLRKSLLILAKIAEAVSDFTAAEQYRKKAADLATAVNHNYFLSDRCYYETETGGYRQVNNIIPVVMGIVPDEKEQAVVERLVQDIHEKGDHLDAGIIGTKYLLPLLSDHGYHELAYAIATQTSYPSWGYWIKNGMNTCLEAWEMTARSRDHYMFGTILDWLWKYIAGFRIEQPGCKKVTIAPRPVGKISQCSWKTETIKGTVCVDWQVVNGRFVLNLMVPDEMEARVILPDGEVQTVIGPDITAFSCLSLT